MANNQTRLYEMDLMRPLIIILMVMMHSFSMYAGGWEMPKGIIDVPAYKWIQVVSYGCMLEAFTFISGYIFGFQLSKKKLKFLPMVLSKLKRLIVPSIIFSSLYIIIFDIIAGWGGVIYWKSIICSIIFSAGHLWFLPMLFWCFIITWFLNRLAINEKIKLAGLFIISIVAVIPMPINLNAVFHYIPFFYLGVYLYNNPFQKINKRLIITLFFFFFLLLITVTLYRDSHDVISDGIKVVLWYVKQLYSSLGTLGVFLVCKKIGEKYNYSNILAQFNACCFGIYIFHQFVLMFLFYYSPLPTICGSYLLPWCGLLCAFFFSYGLTWILRKTKFRNFL